MKARSCPQAHGMPQEKLWPRAAPGCLVTVHRCAKIRRASKKSNVAFQRAVMKLNYVAGPSHRTRNGRAQGCSDFRRKYLPADMAPSDGGGHVCARNRLDIFLGICDCVVVLPNGR